MLSNVSVIIVIMAYRPMRVRVVNLYIINQSLIDASVATFLFLTTVLQDDRQPRTRGNWADEALCRLWFTKMPLWGLLVSSTYNVVSLTAERFLAIVYPLRHRAWCSRRSVSAWLSAAAYAIRGWLHPCPFFLGIWQLTGPKFRKYVQNHSPMLADLALR